MKIYPGIGIGNIKFGMFESDVTSSIGEPDYIEEEEYVLGQGDIYRELFYEDMNLAFSFDKSDKFRLGSICINGYGHLLYEQDIFGMNIKWVGEFISKKIGITPSYEDVTWNKPEVYETLTVDDFGLVVWFRNGKVYELTSAYLFEEDNDTVIWPSLA